MPQVLFSFTFNIDTKEAYTTGNVKPIVALRILQDIVIAQLSGDGKKPSKPIKREVK